MRAAGAAVAMTGTAIATATVSGSAAGSATMSGGPATRGAAPHVTHHVANLWPACLLCFRACYA